MLIKINKNSNNFEEIELLKSAVIFFMGKLLSKEKIKQIATFNVSLVKQLKGMSGDCRDVLTKKNEYVIFIRIDIKQNLLQILSTLAHECVHVAQTIKNYLNIDINGIFSWKGTNYGKMPYFKHKDNIYEKLPWETEAYDKEYQLAKSFIFKYYDETR